MNAPRPYKIMGILNVTPDSFFDGGRYHNLALAIEQARTLVKEGADIIDVGGESTRPGAPEVPWEEEVARVTPVLEVLVNEFPKVQISIDTSKFEVAERAVELGASIINDVTGFSDERMCKLAGKTNSEVVLMHMQGTPRTMQKEPTYENVVEDISAFFVQRIERLQACGVAKERVIVDPGIGFGKTVEHNLVLINHIAQIKELGCRVLVGASRKSFVGHILDLPAEERLEGSLAAAVMAYERGADILRVHDVEATRRGLMVAAAIAAA